MYYQWVIKSIFDIEPYMNLDLSEVIEADVADAVVAFEHSMNYEG